MESQKMGSFARAITPWFSVGAFLLLSATPCVSSPFFFSTGNVTNQIGVASRPGTNSFEIEAADDFVLGSATSLTSATFTGILVGGTLADLSGLVIEIYRVFPFDSDVARTSGPPTFSTPKVPTRVNSPSDVEFDGRDSSVGGELSFTTTTLNASFTTLNSVTPGGIHSFPNQTTLGNGAETGTEIQFNVTFTDPFMLPAGHYFFVPQVDMSTGFFLWLSGTRPIVAPGTPFPPGETDLQSWTRDQFLDPDWLRVGTDIVGGVPAPTFNGAFTLTGVTIPEPGTLALLLIAMACAVCASSAGRRRSTP